MGMTDVPVYEGPWKPAPDHIANLSPRVAPMPPFPSGDPRLVPHLPDPLQPTQQEIAVLAAVIAPIARRMALVTARRAQEAVCDEILRRLESEIGETWGLSKVTGVANIVKAVRANPPQIAGV